MPPKPKAPKAKVSISKTKTKDVTNVAPTAPREQETGKTAKKTTPLHPMEELLGSFVINAEGDTTSPKSLIYPEGVLGLYFAANWCPPCRAIAPELMLLYDEVNKAGNKLELVFVSFDHSVDSFNDYLSKMPWWAVIYDDSEKREEIAFKFGIRGIPILLFLNPNSLDVITQNGRDILLRDPRGKLFPWKSLPIPLQSTAPTPGNSTWPSKQDKPHSTQQQQQLDDPEETTATSVPAADDANGSKDIKIPQEASKSKNPEDE